MCRLSTVQPQSDLLASLLDPRHTVRLAIINLIHYMAMLIKNSMCKPWALLYIFTPFFHNNNLWSSGKDFHWTLERDIGDLPIRS